MRDLADAELLSRAQELCDKLWCSEHGMGMSSNIPVHENQLRVNVHRITESQNHRITESQNQRIKEW